MSNPHHITEALLVSIYNVWKRMTAAPPGTHFRFGDMEKQIIRGFGQDFVRDLHEIYADLERCMQRRDCVRYQLLESIRISVRLWYLVELGHICLDDVECLFPLFVPAYMEEVEEIN